MREYSKSAQKELRKLAGLANDRELEGALAELEAHFSRWRRGEISPYELNDLVHAHHDGVSRELWGFYKDKPDSTVPIAIAKGVIAEEEVPAKLMGQIRESVRHARDMRSTPPNEE